MADASNREEWKKIAGAITQETNPNGSMGREKVINRPRFLSGWKEIANYMGKGVRTVQRYERYLGLPIRRPAGKSRGSVIATSDEIDAWVNASPLARSYLFRETTLDRSALEAFRVALDTQRQFREELNNLRQELQASLEQIQTHLQAIMPDERKGVFERGFRKPN